MKYPNVSTCPHFHKRVARQSGFTAIELIVVLAIALTVIVIAVSRFDIMFSSSNVAEEISNINTLSSSTKTLRTTSGYGTAGTSLINVLDKSGGIPKNLSVVSGVVHNTYGGTIDVTSTGAGYSIVATGIPQSDCIKLAVKQSKAAFYSTTINTSAARVGEVTSTDATTECTSLTANTITWTSAS